MVIVFLAVIGLIFGSFINALVWRVHEQSISKSKSKKRLSILNGRSMCPNCNHDLSAIDLIPVLSWLSLKGNCRYCKKPISKQYPIVELATSALFITSFIWWPSKIDNIQLDLIIIWLILLVGLIALAVYDFRFRLLPNRIIYPLMILAGLYAVLNILSSNKPITSLINEILAVAIGGGIFYILFQVSNGKWIGGGDVRLGWLLGLIVGTPARSLLFIFIASILGTFASIPLLASHRLKRSSTIPFGPFLIMGAFITQLFGVNIISWYTHIILHI